LIISLPDRAGKAVDPPTRDALLVDPSLFTAPYDAALSKGLEANGVRATWSTRDLRDGEEDLLGGHRDVDLTFYPKTDGGQRIGKAWQALKGVEHAIGMRRLFEAVRDRHFDIVHFQWLLLPTIDQRFIDRIRAHCPVVVTVHDTDPFNGKPVNVLQKLGLKRALQACDAIIVHTNAGKQALVDAGQSADAINVVPHGLLGEASCRRARPSNKRWHVVLVGKLQYYKGIDILIEALALIDPEKRAQLHVTIAGEPCLPIAPITARAKALGLETDILSMQFGRLSEAELAALLDQADAFVFPYRSIEASGVLYLVAGLGRWIIASELGAFIDVVGNNGKNGELVPPGDAGALARALVSSLGRTPAADISESVPSWSEIGRRTLAVYDSATTRWRSGRTSAAA
jgi:glycosyltransferase involved in cell wall biosynthesis